jgi:hypothetical protein
MIQQILFFLIINSFFVSCEASSSKDEDVLSLFSGAELPHAGMKRTRDGVETKEDAADDDDNYTVYSFDSVRSLDLADFFSDDVKEDSASSKVRARKRSELSPEELMRVRARFRTWWANLDPEKKHKIIQNNKRTPEQNKAKKVRAKERFRALSESEQRRILAEQAARAKSQYANDLVYRESKKKSSLEYYAKHKDEINARRREQYAKRQKRVAAPIVHQDGRVE